MHEIKLFCIPHAGGHSTMFYPWNKFLYPHINLIPIEMAGRGKRINVPLYSSIDDAVNDIYSQVSSHLSGSSFAFFGHSMGGLIAYELVYKLINLGTKEPVHLFVSGRYPPHIENNQKIIHTLPDDEFVNEVSKWGGIPEELYKYKVLMDDYIPILKSDIKIVEMYNHKSKAKKLNCCITVLNGKQDKLTSEMKGWETYTNRNLRIIEFEGNHFFINKHTESIVSIINNTLGSGYEYA